MWRVKINVEQSRNLKQRHREAIRFTAVRPSALPVPLSPTALSGTYIDVL